MIVIDYRQLLDKIDNPPYTLYSAGDRAAWLDECIATAHAFEAEPVKYGQWIDHEMFERNNCNPCIECSVCNTWFGCDCFPKTKFCPNCGARMRGDSE